MRKYIQPILFLLMFMSICTLFGCGNGKDNSIDSTISKEFDRLENIDLKTASKYISWEDLFEGQKGDEFPNNIKDILSLIFKHLSYEIKDVSYSNNETQAHVTLKIKSISGKALAMDYIKDSLKVQIYKSLGNDEDIKLNKEETSDILLKLLRKNKYPDISEEIKLVLYRKDKKSPWIISPSNVFENALLGGFITHNNDRSLISPQETLETYLKTIKNLNSKSMNEIFENDNHLDNKALLGALLDELHKQFSYKIINVNTNNNTSIIDTTITTFDINEIFAEYKTKIDKYMDSPDAVIDKEEKRYKKAQKMLIDIINKNKKTVTFNKEITLTNNGYRWQLNAKDLLNDILYNNFEEELPQ